MFAAAGVPAGPVYRLDEVFADVQVEHLGMTASVDHPALGRLDLVRNAVTLSGGSATVRSPTPEPGAHSDEIFRGLGLSDRDIADLRARGVI
jgi:formyl-CoA transferase